MLYVIEVQPQLDSIAYVKEKASLTMITYSLCESFQPENSADLALVRTNMTEIRKDDLRSKKAQRILKNSN